MKNKINRYGWLPDVPDHRDLMYSAVKPVGKVPEKIDLRAGCSTVEDQGQLGSCTANALAGDLEYLDKNADGVYTDVSRLFIYYNERVLEGQQDSDAGAMLRDGIKSLAASGVCSETAWPYVIDQFAQKPPARCYTEAKARRISSYHRLTTINEMQACLADGFPFVFGFAVYESFESATVARTGVASLPKKGERMLGGHAVVAVGYTQKDKRFIVRNSWGEGWGQKGYFTLSFAYVETLARDFWTIRR